MKNIIVTGCNGQLGIAINKLLAGNEEYRLVNTDVADPGFTHVDKMLDITDVDEVLSFAREVSTRSSTARPTPPSMRPKHTSISTIKSTPSARAILR